MTNLLWDKPCWGCPFTKTSIVAPERLEEIRESCINRDVHFTCHKNVRGEVQAGSEQVMCRGYYNSLFKTKGVGQFTRIMMRLSGFRTIRYTKKMLDAGKWQLIPWAVMERPKNRRKS